MAHNQARQWIGRLSLIASLALVGCVSGGDDDRPGGSLSGAVLGEAGLLFAQMDKSGDYTVDQTELETGIDEAFAKADLNGDGGVRLVELEAWRAAALGGALRAPGNVAFDPDFNGVVTEAEFRDALLRSVSIQDRDRNGVLTFAELAFDRSFAAPQMQRGGARPPMGQGGQRRPPM